MIGKLENIQINRIIPGYDRHFFRNICHLPKLEF